MAVSLAVVIPAGVADDVEDTIKSVLQFTHSPRRIVVVDDTGHPGRLAALSRSSPDIHVLPAPAHAAGVQGGLWVKVATAFSYVVRDFDFDVLLRLDADALLLGDGLAEAAVERLAQAPNVGLLGSYRYGTDGGVRDWSSAAKELATECGLRGLRKPSLRRLLRRMRALAYLNGYTPGEHALGGAYLVAQSAIRAFADRGWLRLPILAQSQLGEDHLFGLLTVAAGYSIGDFGGPGDPLALRWRGLPAPPEVLLAQGKLATHSVRYWDDLGEAEIRQFFAGAREKARAPRLPDQTDDNS